jgi:hypothetical protein
LEKCNPFSFSLAKRERIPANFRSTVNFIHQFLELENVTYIKEDRKEQSISDILELQVRSVEFKRGGIFFWAQIAPRDLMEDSQEFKRWILCKSSWKCSDFNLTVPPAFAQNSSQTTTKF